MTQRLRQGVRAIVLDPADRLLLVCFTFPEYVMWAAPGGGLEPGESAEDAIRRELREETGFLVDDPGPVIWTRTHVFPFGRWNGQAERYFLVRVPAFEPSPALSTEELRGENVIEIRWWTPEELAQAQVLFAPRRLPELVRALLAGGPPDEPIDVGV